MIRIELLAQFLHLIVTSRYSIDSLHIQSTRFNLTIINVNELMHFNPTDNQKDGI